MGVSQIFYPSTLLFAAPFNEATQDIEPSLLPDDRQKTAPRGSLPAR
jgi:hypothetical protein